MRKCLFEILAERGSTYWKEGLINGCTYYSPVLISLLLKLKKIVKVAMETGFPCISTI